MGEEIIKIKGTNEGLSLEFPNDSSFIEIFQAITTKLSSNTGFFLRGTLVRIPRDRFNDEERLKLQKLFQEHGLICRTAKEEVVVIPPLQPKNNNHRVDEPSTNTNKDESIASISQMMVIDRTIRGGEEIRTEGSVMVLGNVNPGANIIAGGSIDIRGTCRGMVHAGASGNTEAFIIADNLLPTQIRIANLVARPPDEAEISGKPERAFIKDSQIVIATIDR